MNEVFVGAIFSGNWYNGQEEKVSEYIGNKHSILVGMPRLGQLRVMKSKFFSSFSSSLHQKSAWKCYSGVSKVWYD